MSEWGGSGVPSLATYLNLSENVIKVAQPPKPAWWLTSGPKEWVLEAISMGPGRFGES